MRCLINHDDYEGSYIVKYDYFLDYLSFRGRTNVDNFPNVNDYRNIVVAEAMKVLGFVNRHSRGVLRVQKELKANENGDAIFDFSYQTAVMVTENKSPRAERMLKEAIANGLLMEDGQKQSNLAESTDEKQTDLSVSEEKQTQKQTNLADFDFPTLLVKNVYETIKMNRKAKYSWLADNLGVSERTIQRAIDELKRLGYISSEHSKIKGEWQLLK